MAVALALGACGDAPAGESAACDPEAALEYVCGPLSAEDLAAVPDSDLLVTSGLSGEFAGDRHAGHLYLVDTAARSFVEWFPGDTPVLELDAERFPDCPGPLDPARLSAIGLALRPAMGSAHDGTVYDVFVAGSGARSAIEVFEARFETEPAIRWVGCVPMPAGSVINGVAAPSDGSVLVTQYTSTATEGAVAGLVFEWRPGAGVNVLPGTEMSAANGIAVSDDAATMFVVAAGESAIHRFDRSDTERRTGSVELPIVPDNVRWGTDGLLYTVGVRADGGGWAIHSVDPDTLEHAEVAAFGGDVALDAPSTALRLADEIWVGSWASDRIGVMAAG